MLKTTIRVFDMDVELSLLPTRGTRFDRIKLKENVNQNKQQLKLNYKARTNIGNVDGYVQITNVFKKGNYDYVELKFVENLVEIGTKTIKFAELTNTKNKAALRNGFEQLYNKYKFVENETTKELHKQLDQKNGDYQAAQKRIKSLEKQLEQAKQETRDERTKGIVDSMRFEREISDMQKQKESFEKALTKTNTELTDYQNNAKRAFTIYTSLLATGKTHEYCMKRLRAMNLASYLEK